LPRESLMLFRRPPVEYRGRPHGAYVSRSGIHHSDQRCYQLKQLWRWAPIGFDARRWAPAPSNLSQAASGNAADPHSSKGRVSRRRLFRKRRPRQAPTGWSHAAPASSAARAADWLSGSVPLTRAHKGFPAREACRLPCSSQPLTFTKTSSNASVKVTVTAERRNVAMRHR
jgi:hypothetical protein